MEQLLWGLARLLMLVLTLAGILLFIRLLAGNDHRDVSIRDYTGQQRRRPHDGSASREPVDDPRTDESRSGWDAGGDGGDGADSGGGDGGGDGG